MECNVYGGVSKLDSIVLLSSFCLVSGFVIL